MKYMIMMAATKKDLQSFGTTLTMDEIKANVVFMERLNQELKASGEYVHAEGLTGPETHRLVRAQPGGPPLVTDGPFPESKEFLAGYWVLNVKSYERIVEIAARISAAPGPGGKAMNFPVHIAPVGEAPPV
jgi:hypothetical protein